MRIYEHSNLTGLSYRRLLKEESILEFIISRPRLNEARLKFLYSRLSRVHFLIANY